MKIRNTRKMQVREKKKVDCWEEEDGRRRKKRQRRMESAEHMMRGTITGHLIKYPPYKPDISDKP